MPSGRDQRRQVLGHRADEADRAPPPRPRSSTRCAVGVGELPSAVGRSRRWPRGSPTLAPPRGPSVASVRRHDPVDQVVVALVELVVARPPRPRGPASFSASIVGLSFWMNDSNVEAPTRSPAMAKTVLGFVRVRSSLTAPAIAAAPAGALRRVVEQPPVEVVGRRAPGPCRRLSGRGRRRVDADDLGVVVGGRGTGRVRRRGR